MQKERDEYLQQELTTAKEAAQNLAKKTAKAQKEAQERAAFCSAAEAALNDLKASKPSIEELCREKTAAHAVVNKQHNALLDTYALLPWSTAHALLPTMHVRFMSCVAIIW
jgi:hypothetical protein